MKSLSFSAAFVALLAAQPLFAGYAADVNLVSPSSAVQHGGGCRKDSPRGQCCHAGSKPYHCH